MKQGIAYYRVSTTCQGRSGLGLEAQRTSVEAFALQHDYLITSTFIEVETGKGADALARRPQLNQAMQLAKRTQGTVLVSRLDRLSRNVHFISGLMERRVPFKVASLPIETESFMLHIYAAVAEQERDLTSKRTKEALQAAKARGVLLGNRTNIADARVIAAQANRQASQIRREALMPHVDALRAQGVVSYAGIARALNERGVATARGGAWYASSVRNLLL